MLDLHFYSEIATDMALVRSTMGVLLAGEILLCFANFVLFAKRYLFNFSKPTAMRFTCLVDKEMNIGLLFYKCLETILNT